MADQLREAATATADWLDLVQKLYHGIVQKFPAEDRDTCEYGMCGDYRKHRDALRAALDQEPEAVAGV